MSKTLKDPNEALLRAYSETTRRLEAIERRPKKISSVRRLTAQSINGGATGFVPVIFEQITIDSDEMFDTALPTRLTCKSSGYYLVVTNLTLASNTTHKAWFGLRLNGLDFLSVMGSVDELPQPNKSGCATAVVALGVGDYVESMIAQDDGSPKNLTPANGPCNLSAVLVS